MVPYHGPAYFCRRRGQQQAYGTIRLSVAAGVPDVEESAEPGDEYCCLGASSRAECTGRTTCTFGSMYTKSKWCSSLPPRLQLLMK